MSEARPPLGVDQLEGRAPGPGGHMDPLGVAAVLLGPDGRIDMWSPQAERLFGYTAEEAVGRYAAALLVRPEQRDDALALFAQALASGRSWSGAFPVRRKDGTTRLTEFGNVRLTDGRGRAYALGMATDRPVVQRLERGLTLSVQLVAQSPIGLGVLDTDLRYLSVNPALAAMHGVPEDDHIGRTFREVLPGARFRFAENALRQVLRTGTPIVDRYVVGRTPADLTADRAWSVSYYRLEDHDGRALGVATAVVDVTDRHRSAQEADRARWRLAVIADSSARIGTSLEVEQTARELAEVAVPELADIAAVDVLDSALRDDGGEPDPHRPRFRAISAKCTASVEAASAFGPPGRLVSYGPDHLAAHCLDTGRPGLMTHADERSLLRIARDPDGASLLARAGVHSAMAVPLIARGRILGVLGLARAHTPEPFDEDDQTLAGELASRAAVSMDNARLHEQLRSIAETLQRSLLPQLPPVHPRVELAARYCAAQASSEVGGDWYDVIPFDDGRVAFVIGDVMGSGVPAATTMGRLRTATSTLAGLGLEPAQVLGHLDRITYGLDPYIATCVYAVYDPARGVCHLANAGHLPPVVVRVGEPPELLDLPTGTPLGVVGGASFESTTVDLGPGDRLVLYTDGLVETRDRAIDERLDDLLRLLDVPEEPVEETCDRLLTALRHPEDRDDVALLIARPRDA
ncbi:SpoIIE family protein phosphatase [Streptomyces sp. ME01-24h]|nr:SpoIIE family protein phosphatase [Streptomyces sp. ME19-03-3]MDX3355465.1 SpoIIE family protein phosphatase [Streptomyces sp. ME01-24h]